jgi:uncharacterized membrane protein
MDSAKTAKSAKPAIHLFDANHRFILACVVGGLTFLALHHHGYAVRFIGAWVVFALSVVSLAWAVILTKDPYEVRRDARFQDASATVIFVITLSAAAASLFAVIMLLGATKNLPPTSFISHIVLSISAIALSWTLVHTLFSIHYARLYYIEAPKKKRDAIEGGLVFPGDKNPDYLDFAYFSFVIGMTSQVSDVQISSKKLRRMATLHGLLSFAFNTAILAMFVNIVASLI